MNKTQVAREVADALHKTEASLEATLAGARRTLERMVAAKAELGLTGTLGDAGLARIREAVEALETSADLIWEGHQEAYAVMKTVYIRPMMPVTDRPTGFDRSGDNAKIA